MPDQPSAAYPSTALFGDSVKSKEFWLPQPPGANCPELQAFWTRLNTGITEYRTVQTKDGPEAGSLILSVPPERAARSDDWVRLNGRGRQSRSPNWSGTTVHAVDGAMLTQVVGTWREPAIAATGSYTTAQEFRSSVWVGFNGHAAYYDAALPQIGTMQRIAYDGAAGWQNSHWVWFEWWANTKANDIAPNLLPIYINLEVRPGDTVLCSLELIPGDPARDFGAVYPYVARMCLCVEHTDTSVEPHVVTKVLIMPFIVFPPLVDGYQVRATGSAASWIAERPTSLDRNNPFLLPRFIAPDDSLLPIRFENCAAALATDAGQAMFGEQTLGVSRRVHMISRLPDSADAMTRIATTIASPSSVSTFDVVVNGSDQ